MEDEHRDGEDVSSSDSAIDQSSRHDCHGEDDDVEDVHQGKEAIQDCQSHHHSVQENKQDTVETASQPVTNDVTINDVQVLSNDNDDTRGRESPKQLTPSVEETQQFEEVPLESPLTVNHQASPSKQSEDIDAPSIFTTNDEEVETSHQNHDLDSSDSKEEVNEKLEESPGNLLYKDSLNDSQSSSTVSPVETTNELKADNDVPQLNQSLHLEVERLRQGNLKLSQDLERLRNHLISIEDSYTEELIAAEEREKTLRDNLSSCQQQLQQLQLHYNPDRSNAELQELKAKIICLQTERDSARSQSSKLDDQLQSLSAMNERLQLILEQTTKDYEEKLSQLELKSRQELEKESVKLHELSARLKWQEEKFQESVAALGAAGRLSHQIDIKENYIRSLRDDIMRRDKELSLSRKEIQELKASQEGKVDKAIIKNLVLGYFCSPADQKHEVERLLARILDFNQEEMDRAKLKIGSNRRSQQQNESLAAMFVQFLENESSPSAPSPAPSTSSSSSTASSSSKINSTLSTPTTSKSNHTNSLFNS